ncbi:MAG: SAF domain-containing protein, partial [Planctomycetota bacterium]
QELEDLIYGTRAIYEALEENKFIAEEKQTMKFAFASVVSIRQIEAGEVLTTDNIWVKRPGTGEIPAFKYA